MNRPLTSILATLATVVICWLILAAGCDQTMPGRNVCHKCHVPQKPLFGWPIWNKANPSIGTEVIWDQNNPSYTGPCTTFTHVPKYRTSGTAKPIAATAPYNPLPYCWSCHGSGYWVYGNMSTPLIYYSYSGMNYRVQHSK